MKFLLPIITIILFSCNEKNENDSRLANEYRSGYQENIDSFYITKDSVYLQYLRLELNADAGITTDKAHKQLIKNLLDSIPIFKRDVLGK